MAALSFAGKLHRLSLALDLVGAGRPIGTKDRERYVDPILGPGWEAVARGIVQRRVAPGELIAVFEEVAGGEGEVAETVLASLHDEACHSPAAWVLFATASSMVRASTVVWAPKGWGLVESERPLADALNVAASRYILQRRSPAGFYAALCGEATALGVCDPDAALRARMALLASAYRSAWLREALDAALTESGSRKALAGAVEGEFVRKLQNEVQFVARTRTPRTSDGVERARRRASLDERVEFYLENGFDLTGLDDDERRRLAAKGVFSRDGKLRLFIERRFVRDAAAVVNAASDQLSAVVRFLRENGSAIDMPGGECLEDLAELRGSEIAVVFNCEALIVRAAKRDAEADARAARDLDEVLFEARRTMLRLDPSDSGADLVAVLA